MTIDCDPGSRTAVHCFQESMLNLILQPNLLLEHNTVEINGDKNGQSGTANECHPDG